VFVDVIKNEQLALLRTDLEDFLLAEEKFPLKKELRPFHPHITIATRDLYKKAFFEAWDIFQNKKYKAEWEAKGVSILRHNKKNWDVIHTSQLSS
jgi:2'-5' RNA ligase